MNWVEALNQTLDYIENNLCADIAWEDIAGSVYISGNHLQRAFVLLTGITMGEYIRNRRMTLAGQELISSGAKVIDVALRYGYDTPESFSKAFSRFHGISPSGARKDGASLKSYNRLAIKIVMEGGTIMDYRIVTREAFNVVVKSRLFTQENSTTAIPAFWGEYYAAGLHKKVSGCMGICDAAVHSGGEYAYGIGAPETTVVEIPDGFELWTIPASCWAVFKCVGAMPLAIQSMWKRVYSEWLPQAKYELIPGYDIELYTAGDNSSDDYVSEIWIRVQEK